MKNRLIFALIYLLSTAGMLHAQRADELGDIYVTLAGIVVWGSSNDSTASTATLTYNSTTLSSVSRSGTTNGSDNLPRVGMRMVPGTTYTMSMTVNNVKTGGTLLGAVGAYLSVAAPTGYSVVVNNVPRIIGTGSFSTTSTTSTVTFKVMLLSPSGNLGLGAGMASSLRPAWRTWQLSLGSLPNGNPAGNLYFNFPNTTASLATVFTTANLQCDAISSEVITLKDSSGNIRQIISPQVCIDIVPAGGTQIDIKCYPPAVCSTTLTNGFYTFTGFPYAWYMVKPGTSDTAGVTIECDTRSASTQSISSGNAANVLYTSLTRSGSAPYYSWTAQDWHSGSTPLTQTVRARAASSATETISSLDANSATVAVATRTYSSMLLGEEITQVQIGSSNPITTSYNFYMSDTTAASYGQMLTVASSSGGWQGFEYNNQGLVQTFDSPWVNSDVGVPGNFPQHGGVKTNVAYTSDPFGGQTRPATSSTTLNGSTYANSSTSYTNETPFSSFSSTHPNLTVVNATRTDSASGSVSFNTITKYIAEDAGAPHDGLSMNPYDDYLRGLPHSLQRPDGVKQVFVYQRGSYVGGTFTPNTNSGLDYSTALPSGQTDPATAQSGLRAIAITGTASGSTQAPSENGYPMETVYLVDGKSTKEVTLRNAYADVVRTETYAWSGGAWNLVSYTNFTYNLFHQLVSSTASNGATYAATYTGEQKLTETDASGITMTYTYDAGDRLSTAIKSSGPTITYGYEGGTSTQTVSASGTGETIYSGRHLDDAGRVSWEDNPGISRINHSYNVAGRSHTVSYTDGSAKTEYYFADGQLDHVDGSGTVPQYYAYDISSSAGQVVTWVYSGVDGRSNAGAVSMTGTATGRWQKQSNDWLGRIIHSERPGYAKTGQANYTEDNTYDDGTNGTGRLLTTVRSGLAPIRYEYDALSNPVRSGLSVAGSTLVNASADRISEQNQYFENYSGAWWLHQENRTYPKLNDATVVVTSMTRKRLTGFSANRLEETQTTDAEGNTAVRTVDVNLSTATTTITTTRPAASNPEVQTIVNGLATNATGHDGLTTTMQYDALTRASKRTDSRGNTITTAYTYGSTLVQSVQDGAGNLVSFVSYDGLGRKQWVQDAGSHYTRFAYNLRGQLTNQWGDGSYPVQYGYDPTYGDRTSLSTYRNAPSGDSASWPSVGSADTTTWNYDSATGLLYQKIDAGNQVTSFDYNTRGQTSYRYWARALVNTPGTNLKTSYAYDGNTGELTGVSYNDGGDPLPTPAVTYSYTRLGQVLTVGDATGSRTFNYDAAMPWRLDSESLDSTFYAARLLTRNYDVSSTTNGGTYGQYTAGQFKGRYVGYDLGVAGNTARDQHVGYTTSNLAQFVGVNARVSSQSARDYVYNYVTNSSLLGGYVMGSNFAIVRTYETQRDLLTGINTQWGVGSNVSSFAYTYNALAQRQTAQTGGSAFADYWSGLSYSHVFNNYSYNARGELQTSATYRGDTASTSPSSTDELPGRRFEFRYDSIGNRVTSGETGSAASGDDTYSVNSLNQYSNRENNTVRTLGTASATAKVAVGYAASTNKVDRAWGADIVPANTSAPVASSAKVYAAFPGGGTGGLDLIRSDSKGYFVPMAVQSFSYDQDGNMISDGIWTYTYNAENQLIRAQTTSPAITAGWHNQRIDFTYDYLGRRVQKHVVDSTASTDVTTKWVFDGWNPIAETDGSSNLQRVFTWGLDVAGSLSASGGVGALLQISDLVANKSLAVGYDGNGNVATLVNIDTGATEAAYEYNPFGELLRCDGTYAKSNPFRFSTKWQDDETGLLNYGTRYYSPTLGRFINRDPIAEKGGLNLYGFCGNDGIDGVDYLGYSWLSKLWDRTVLSLGKKIAQNWNHQGRGFISALLGGPVLLGLEGYSFRTCLGATLFGSAYMLAPQTFNRYGGIVLGAVVGVVVGIATANPALGALAGGFVSGAVTTYMQGGTPLEALESGVIGAGVSLITYGVVQGLVQGYTYMTTTAGSTSGGSGLPAQFWDPQYAQAANDGVYAKSVILDNFPVVATRPSSSATIYAELMAGFRNAMQSAYAAEIARTIGGRTIIYGGKASVYISSQGHKTAYRGYSYDRNSMAAAFPSDLAKAGTVVDVEYNGNTIQVVVNDNGPWAVDGVGDALKPLEVNPDRVIDLTPAAMKALTGKANNLVDVIVSFPSPTNQTMYYPRVGGVPLVDPVH